MSNWRWTDIGGRKPSPSGWETYGLSGYSAHTRRMHQQSRNKLLFIIIFAVVLIGALVAHFATAEDFEKARYFDALGILH